MSRTVTVSFELGALDPEVAESACFACGATAVTFADARDEPVLEPLPGEVRLWPSTRLSALFSGVGEPRALAAELAARLALPAALVSAEVLPERVWEREWLKDFHAMRFGERLWVCPRHEQVTEPAAVIVTLDPGLAFGTGTHPTTALCLTWLDAHAHELRAPAEHSVERRAHGLDAHAHELRAPGARAIDYGCGSGVLGLACAKLGAAEVHCFDIDPQALSATRENALANGVGGVVRVHEHAAELPAGVDVLAANILSGPLCTLAPAFASLVRPGGVAVLAGLMRHEVRDVTDAYSAWFDVEGGGESGDWACLSARRR
ncbi:MAG TPA: 50S ribosomal protein L11 methyltransferase [Steroidobacteraceae bacterium]|nr:50S ribosomal protein L11 methyltransferase [Steroidobacteraceae bacterium]